MAVEAINSGNQNRTAQAVTGGITAGAIGATAGYFMNRPRPTLEEVFKLDNDTFESVTKDLKDGLNDDVQKIKYERTVYLNAENSKNAEIGEKRDVMASMIDKTAPENKDLINFVDTKKNELYTKTVKIEDKDVTFEQLNKNKQDAIAELKKAITDDEKAIAKEKLNKAKADLKAFLEVEENKKAMSEYVKAKRKLQAGRIEAFNKEVTEHPRGGKARTVAEIKKLREEVVNAKKTILENEETVKAFEKIRKLFPRDVKWCKVGIWTGIAVAVGAIGGYLFGGNKA